MAKPTNPYNKYDKSVGLWIRARKRVFFYWFRFLQAAERSDSYTVDWTHYERWGGRDEVMKDVKRDFDKWWATHWQTLFGTVERRGEPLMKLSEKRISAESYGYAYQIYLLDCSDEKLTRIQIAFELNEGYKKRHSNFKTDHQPFFTDIEKPEKFPYIEKMVSNYRLLAKSYLTNVCEGKFP